MNNEELYQELTSYVLGELSPDRKLKLEATLENDETLRKELEAVRETVATLEEHFSEEALPELTDSQKANITQAAQKKPLLLFPKKWTAGLSAIAAVFVVVLTLNPSFLPKQETVPRGESIFLSEEDASEVLGQEPYVELMVLEEAEAPVDALGELNVLDSFDSPVVMKGRYANRSSSGRASQLAQHESTDESGVIASVVDSRVQGGKTDSFGLEPPAPPSPAAPQPSSTYTFSTDRKPKGAIRNKRSYYSRNKKDSLKRAAGQPLPNVAGTLTLAAVADSEFADADGFSAPREVQDQIVPAKQKTGKETRPRPQAEPKAIVQVEAKLQQEHIWGPSLEDYKTIVENEIKRVSDHPLSTFSIDVDTASYSNMRRFLKNGTRPPADAIRIEELINYFNYDYEGPSNEVPFATHIESATCPWQPEHRLVRIGLKGKVIAQAERPALNLVFLLDVSGSMNNPNKLGLVKKSMKALLGNLDERDRVSIVVYAGASGLVLPPTNCADKQAIIEALDRLTAGGSTNGGAGIDLAYKTAMQNYNKEGVNRVILCTDGDFNVGRIQTGDLVRDVEAKAKEGVFLSILGFGMGNYKDETLEQLADKGNGNYAYIDTYSEARKVLVDQMTGTLVTIAKDVKIQVEFNPKQVAGYRLIGYENRMLAKEDFNDDKKDAGEIGAGHTVTALYEIIPAGQEVDAKPAVDELKYAAPKNSGESSGSAEMLTVKLRYKQPDEDVSSKVEFPFVDSDQHFEQATEDFRFASSVAGFGLLLRDSQYKGGLSFDDVLNWSADAQGEDEFGYRREFNELVRNAKSIMQ